MLLHLKMNIGYFVYFVDYADVTVHGVSHLTCLLFNYCPKKDFPCPGNILYFSTPVSILNSGVELRQKLSFLNVIFNTCSSELKVGKL